MSSLPSVTHGSAPRNPALAWFEAEPLDAWWSLMLGRLHGSIRAQGCPLPQPQVEWSLAWQAGLLGPNPNSTGISLSNLSKTVTRSDWI